MSGDNDRQAFYMVRKDEIRLTELAGKEYNAFVQIERLEEEI